MERANHGIIQVQTRKKRFNKSVAPRRCTELKTASRQNGNAYKLDKRNARLMHVSEKALG